MSDNPFESLGALWIVVALLAGVGLLVSVFLYWRIFSKAGFNGAWALLMLIPLGNFIAIVYLALAEWPIERRIREHAPPPATYPPPTAPYPR